MGYLFGIFLLYAFHNWTFCLHLSICTLNHIFPNAILDFSVSLKKLQWIILEQIGRSAGQMNRSFKNMSNKTTVIIHLFHEPRFIWKIYPNIFVPNCHGDWNFVVSEIIECSIWTSFWYFLPSDKDELFVLLVLYYVSHNPSRKLKVL